MKTKIIPDNKVTVIGDISNYLKTAVNQNSYDFISGYLFFSYKGISMYEFVKPFASKEEAIKFSKGYVESSRVFADGTKPFCIVFYRSGGGWYSLTANTTTNDRIVRENMQVT